MWFWYNDFRVERCLLLEPGRWLDLKLSYNKYSCTASATSSLTETDFLWFHWIENSIHIYKSLSAIGTINFVATLKSTPTCLQIQIEFCIRRYCSGCWKLDVWCATADNLPTNSPTQIFFHQHTSCAIRRQRAMQEKKNIPNGSWALAETGELKHEASTKYMRRLLNCYEFLLHKSFSHQFE